jgi:UDP-N-acetylmuramate dehydrogenase
MGAVEILSDQPLKPLNTFGLDARAPFLACPDGVDALREALAFARERALPVLVLGGGSNIVLAHDPVGLVLRPAMTGRRVLSDADDVLLHVGAGEDWTDLVAWTLDQGLWGLENLSLIPGTAGAAPIQNIGAYGVELSDHLHALEAVEIATGRLRTFSAEECRFGYRDSVFKQSERDRWVVVGLVLRLSRHPALRTGYGTIRQELDAMGIAEPGPVDVARAVIRIRRSKLPDPSIVGNCGSFFSNPVVDATTFMALVTAFPGLPAHPQGDGRHKLAAAWLIDQCGLRGARRGPVGIHPDHALVMVNHGGATGRDVLALADAVREAVRQRFGVALEIEPRVV